MTDDRSEQIFESRLRQAVDDLSQDGWDVTEKPSTNMLPESLRGRRPDLIARRGKDLLIGEVKSRHSTDLYDLSNWANLVSSIANARFEVYWLGDSHEARPPAESIEAFIRDATQLHDAGYGVAATLTAWSAFEGALIHFASDKSNLRFWQSPRQLLSDLYSLGHIGESDFMRLLSFGKVRNEIAHHASRYTPKPADLNFVLKVAERMANDQYISVDRMVEWLLDATKTQTEARVAFTILRDHFTNASYEDLTRALELYEEIGVEPRSRPDASQSDSADTDQ